MPDAGQIRTDRLDPEREARRRLALSQIRRYPDPVLRMRAREVERFDEDLARLAQRMIELMRDANGVGLAANQVGVLQRVFILQATEDDTAQILVNPVVTPIGDETEIDDEGCLSLPGVLVPIERSVSVLVEARSVSGAERRLELEGMIARAAQHELDHLDGVLLIDRTTPEARREALAILRPRAVISSSG